MKITFIEDHQSVLSGHSFYAAGAQADLRKGQQLIDGGIAFEGWGNPPVKEPPPPVKKAVKKPARKTTRTRRKKS